MRGLSVLLPWPADVLWNNASPHRFEKARATKAAKHDAYYAALAAGARGLHGAPAYTIDCTFTPPMKPGPARDMLNCRDALKASFDGIAWALDVDDRLFRPGRDSFNPKSGHGHVLIEITPIDAWQHVSDVVRGMVKGSIR